MTRIGRVFPAIVCIIVATLSIQPAAGVSDSDIVRLTQLIGFVVYQVRFAAGLRLINRQ